MKDLNYELKLLCQRNRDGSYATQHAREDSKRVAAPPVYFF